VLLLSALLKEDISTIVLADTIVPVAPRRVRGLAAGP